MKYLFILLFLTFCSSSFAQEKQVRFITKFESYNVTYNASDNPNQCWEAASWGLVINKLHFSLPYKMLEELKQKAGTSEMEVEVVYFDEPLDGSGDAGNVVSVKLNNEVVFKR
jgi:hypothetical protein